MSIFAVIRSGLAVAPMRAIRRRIFGLLCVLTALIGAVSTAEAVCGAGDTTTASKTSAAITATAIGNIVRLCITDDVVLFGLYGTSNGANPNIDARNALTLPMIGTVNFDPLNYNSSKATYTLTPRNQGLSQIPEYEITLNSQSGAGADTITLWYANQCSYTDGCLANPSLTNTSFTLTVNLPPPTISTVAPASGPQTGGNMVTINGTNFTGTAGAAGVKFGTVNATSYSVLSNTQISADVPASLIVGAVDVTVTNGGVTATKTGGYTYLAVPTIISLSPSSGPETAGTQVTITGTNLDNASAVTFGGNPATGVIIDSSSQIRANAPAGTGVVDVRVTTPGGMSAIVPGDQYTYVPAPAVTSISPTSGPESGGTTVTVSGSNLGGVTAVSFGTAATTFTPGSSTSFTAVAPAGTGIVDVRVTTAGGISATSAADRFTYLAAPTITSITPTAGPVTGGTAVMITGTNFTGVSAVSFGGVPAASYLFNSSTSITANAPAGTSIVDIRVTTPGGTSAVSAADQFTYVAAPVVTSINPTSGPASGGTPVTITGSNFSGATTVTFGATTASGFMVASATSITVNAPAGTGMVDVRVTTVGGTSTTSAADQFTYIPAPVVTSISPTSGPITGTTSVTITGSNFNGVTAVSFGGQPAAGYTFNSSTSITAGAPPGTGIVDITVTTPGGTSAASAADQFTYYGPPSITSITPTAGPIGGTTVVTITGNNLGGVTAVSFGATAATTFNGVSATSVTATSPAGAAGTVNIQVTTPGGTTTATAASEFTYVALPVVTSISPTSGPAAGGTTVTITGSNLTNPTAVSFGGVAATSYSPISATSMSAVAPPGTGLVDIRVTTAGGISATSAGDQFTYIPGPVVTSISPTSGPEAGGTLVTISGSNFTSASAVHFGATLAPGFNVASSSSITVNAPAGTGTVDVRVTTPGGQSPIEAADQFTYIAAPTITSITPTGGPIGGGTSVTITGTGFSSVTSVTFGGTLATSHNVTSTTSITATSPAAAAR